MSGFIEYADSTFALQLKTFAEKLPAHAAVLGFSNDEVKEAQDDAAFFNSILEADTQMEKHAHDYKHFKQLLRHGSKTEVISTVPIMPVLNPFPTMVAANLELRFSKKAAKAKASTNYTSGIGQDLGSTCTRSAAIARRPASPAFRSCATK